jgi:hypothetical protein
MSVLLVIAVLFAPVLLSSMMVDESFDEALGHPNRH